MSSALSKLESLAGLMRHDGANTKPALLRVLTDFYTQKPEHSADEDRHFTELALRLIGEVDRATRQDIARRLAEYGRAPDAVLRRLNTEPDSERDMRATEAPTTQSDAVRPAILSSDRAAAANFSERFFAADASGRRALLRDLSEGAVAPLAITDLEALRTCQNLENAALRSRPYEFVLEMERALNISRPIAQAIVNDLSGEPMLVVAKALGMPIDVVQRILLLVNPAVGNSVRRVFELSELYQEMSPRAAWRLISLWRNADERPSEAPASQERVIESVRRALGDPERYQTIDTRPPPRRRDQRAS